MSPEPVEQLVSSPCPAALSQGASYKSKETISKRELLVWVQECKARPLWSSDRSLSHHRITAGVAEFHLSKLSGLVLPGLPYHLAPIPLLLLISKKGAQDCPLSSARRVSLAPGHTPASSSKALSRCNPCKWPWGLSQVSWFSTLTAPPRGRGSAENKRWREPPYLLIRLFHFFFL